MIKWGLISKFDSIPRFEFLSRYLLEKHQFENEFIHLQCEMDEFNERLSVWQNEFDQLRVGPPFGSLLAADLDRSNALTMTSRTADCLQKIDSKWWPRSLLEEGVLRSIVRSHLNLDIHTKAMVIGTGASAKAVIMPLIKLGFASIAFTDSNAEEGYEFVRTMRQRIFNVNFDFIEQRDISLLPGSFGVVINTTPNMKENTLVQDLSYFNYLKAGGLAVDLSAQAAKTKFVSQALLVKAQTVAGVRIAADVDAFWVEMCFDIDMDIEQYEHELTEFLEQGPKS